MSVIRTDGRDDGEQKCEPLHNNPSRARTGNEVSFSEALKAVFSDSHTEQASDHYYTGGEWATVCVCGHHDHGYGWHREDMCCTEPGCDCGGYEPQPGMALPTIRHEGPHPFLLILRSRP